MAALAGAGATLALATSDTIGKTSVEQRLVPGAAGLFPYLQLGAVLDHAGQASAPPGPWRRG